MRVVKYFFEEPASLEVLAPDLSPDGRAPEHALSLESFLGQSRYFRGYLSWGDTETHASGATAARDSGDWLDATVDVFAGLVACNHAGPVPLGTALAQGKPGEVLVLGDGDFVPQVAPLKGEVREHLGRLKPMLDEGFNVAVGEPAHDGTDWAFFSADPMAERFRVAFGKAPSTAERFVIPHQKARGEHRFYFERYDLAQFEAYRI